MKKYLLVILALIITILLVSIIWVKYVPASSISFLKSDSGLGKVLCQYPVKIQGSSMEPDFLEGSRIIFSKCFEKNALDSGTFVVFRERNYTRVGKIQSVKEEKEEVMYEVVQNARPEEVFQVSPNDIVAVKT
jgi:signal peptidase I